MKFEYWIKKVISSGNLCNGYEDKVKRAASRKQLMDLCLDANGINYLCEMQAAGYPLPYETICNEFVHYINGKYVAEYYNDNKHGYTSCLYCCYDGELEVNTTLICLLGCNITNMKIKENAFVKIYCDPNCIVDIDIPNSSRAIIETWGNAQVYFDDKSNIEIKNHA